MSLSRRSFLKSSLAGISAAGLSNMAVPSISFGQGTDGPRIVVVVQLLGGLDPLLAFPYLSSADYSALANIRGDVARINPAVSARLNDNLGKLGLNPNLNQLAGYLNRMKIFLHTGNALHLGHNGSHEVATLRMVLGGSPDETGRKGWMARLYEQNKAKLIGFGGAAASFACDKCDIPPLVTSSYEALDLSAPPPLNSFTNWEKNTKDIETTLRLLSKAKGASELDNKYRAFQRSMFEGIDLSKRTLSYITPQSKKQTASGVVNNYEIAPTNYISKHSSENEIQNEINHAIQNYLHFARQFRNIAQTVLEYKQTFSNERAIFVTAQGGYDLHDNWMPTGHNIMATLGRCLKVFLDDLSEMQMLDKVVVLITSEFGRTIKSQGEGTDHGRGYPAILIGGKVNGGIVGTPLTVAQLEARGQSKLNFWPQEIAQERIIIEMLDKFLKINSDMAFPPALKAKIPTHGELNIFSA